MSQPEETTEQMVQPGGKPAEAAADFSAPRVGSGAAPLLMGVKLGIRVLMGRTHLALRDVVRLGNGSVVELDCSPDDPVSIVVNDRLIAQGEIVVVDGNYGVRITRIASGQQPTDDKAETDLLGLSERLK